MSLGIPIQMLNGLGCSCSSQIPKGFGSTTDYDQITIGGKVYSANQILDKTIVAGKDTKIYSGVNGTPTVLGTIKAGQPIGIVFSYLRPEQGGGRSWLMFETSYNKYFYVPNEAASATGLISQGVKTVKEEVKQEEVDKLKEESPVEYYLSKYGTKAILIVGGIVIAVAFGKEVIKGLLSKKTTPTPSLSGTRKRKRKPKK